MKLFCLMLGIIIGITLMCIFPKEVTDGVKIEVYQCIDSLKK